jgi:PAS domain S-box-containing protein
VKLTKERIMLEQDLVKALERDEFLLYYQPKIDLISGKIIAVEALIRWEHPEKGLLYPAEFMPSTEETGLIIPIGDWVLKTACMQNKAWQDIGLSPLLMSVNISVRQLYQPNFVDNLLHTLNETKLPSEYLELEITESGIQEPDLDPKIIKELKQMGIQICLDDFGIGYNSFHHLTKFPIDKVKIDRSLINNCTIDSLHTTKLKMIITMAQQLEIEVIAKGIESKDQLSFLKQNLCNQGQGYLFSIPLTPEMMVKNFYKIEQIINQGVKTRELSNLKMMEESLGVSPLAYSLITENLQDSIMILDKNLVIHYASPSHEIVFGIPGKVYEGHTALKFVHPEDITYVQTKYDAMTKSKTTSHMEFRQQNVLGGWVLIEAKVTPVSGKNNELEFFVVVGRDISERKQIEELDHKSEKLSAIGHLASSIAHEIRNPLTTIKGFAQLLQMEVDKPSYIDPMLFEIYRLEEIVQEFLSFAKPQIHQLKETELIQLIQQVLLNSRSRLIMNNIKIVQEFSSDLKPIYCDESQIKQVLVQILQNADESMPNGGTIKIQIFSYDKDFMIIRFIDQGHGIPIERLRKIGEPFYSIKEKGTGLGLMISHKIMEEHGGKLIINSTIKEGTTVDVILPVFKGKV